MLRLTRRASRLHPRLRGSLASPGSHWRKQALLSSFASGSSERDVPTEAEVVIIGGGIIGNSVAYHLAKAGVKDVVLLEQDRLTAGTTWHAAGLMVTFGSLSETATDIRKYSKELYRTLEAETGLATGFSPVGFIELATEPDRLEEYRRISAFNRAMGVDVREISAAEVEALFPICRTDDVLAGFYVEDDGRVNPVDACMSLAKGAKMHGATVVEGVRVAGVTRDAAGTTVTGVVTEGGQTIRAGKVVNCAGMWARQLAEQAGVVCPNQAAEHYYLVTDAMPEVGKHWPVVEDPANYTYIRPEGGGLMVGLFEAEAAAWNVRSVPGDFAFGEIGPDWERMAPYLEKAMSRVPATLDAGMKTFFCGPESFTPDLGPVVGEAPELRNYFLAAGLNSIGILSGPGIGRLVAHWVRTGAPDADVTGMNVDRFQRFHCTPAFRGSRVVESLGKVYKAHYPHAYNNTARGVKRSPVHRYLEEAGACFVDVSGWEAPGWFADLSSGQPAVPDPLGWGRHHWFENWAAEHRACREGVALIDMSFMSKFMVEGPGAGALLDFISTAAVDGPEDTITYTQWLNARGTLEADLTVTKLARDKFLVVATDTMHRHVETWMRRHAEDRGDAGVSVTDVTGAYAQFNLQGPQSRELLARLTSADVSNEAYPFRTAREIDVGYVGELGYELFVPAEQAACVFERIMEESAKPDAPTATLTGLRALSSLRLEKAYRDYGHDLDNTDSLVESGLAFTCAFDKPAPFLGQACVEADKARGIPPRRLLQVLLEDPKPMMYHGEVVLRDGEVVGDIRAASYGHTLGGAVGLSMVSSGSPDQKVNKKWMQAGAWEVDVAGVRYPARVSAVPMYDPKNARIKA